MVKMFHTIGIILGLIIACAVIPFGSVLAADSDGVPSSVTLGDGAFQSAAAVQEYWTAERMADAIPMPMPEYEMPAGASSAAMVAAENGGVEDLVPYVSEGWTPGSGPQPDPTVGYAVATPDLDAAAGADFQAYGSPPSNPLSGPYPPFQRWTHYQNYTRQATATIGKLFFTDGTFNYVCSASVISRRTIATAAHCLHSGGPSGSFYTGWMFCPSYFRADGSGGPHPTRGCWSWNYGRVSNAWVSYTGGAADRDYGCLMTASTGTVHSTFVGNITGWTGRAWNFASQQPMVSWGYPAGAPFSGYHIILATSAEWYEVNMTSGDGHVSKYMGNDMTGGSSGGPWWMSVGHNTYEYPDTDGSWATDPGSPGGPYLNGVNSHKRCRNGCFTPPTATAGTFWQEMGSPQFRNTAGDTDESEDIFASCFAQE
jgi:V8-like Glu-specific endopeptidase